MKEQIHTIPIADAMANSGECPFCYIERRTENHTMDFVLGHGASYMEADIRDMTDREGFCRAHFKKMFDYGNSLGNAWILKTLYMRHLEELDKEIKHFKPDSTAKKGLFSKRLWRMPLLLSLFQQVEKITLSLVTKSAMISAYMEKRSF